MINIKTNVKTYLADGLCHIIVTSLRAVTDDNVRLKTRVQIESGIIIQLRSVLNTTKLELHENNR